MFVIFPVTAFVLFFWILWREEGLEWRKASLAAAVFWGTAVAIGTECLSVPSVLTRAGVVIFWLIVCGSSVLYIGIRRRRGHSNTRQENPELPMVSPARSDSTMKILLVATGIIVLLVGFTALLAAPNTWDAMEYHLPRVVMWMSNQNVRFFPTPDFYLLIYGPWAEFAMTHLHLLWGNDRLVNLVEFFSFLGSIIGASLVARELGAGPRGQVLAAIVCATIPEGILEASGPMNTYVLSFWILTTVAFLLSWAREPNWLNATCLGLSTGLAILTKGTAYVYLPFIGFAIWLSWSAATRVLFLRRVLLFLFLICALNGPQFLRCYNLSGTPLGAEYPGEEPELKNTVAHPSVRGTLANMVRMASLQIGTPSSAVNSALEKLCRLSIKGLGMDADDPGMIWGGYRFHVHHFSLHEIHAGNPLHAVLLALSLGLIFWKLRGADRRKPFWYAIGLIAAFIFFCASLRWNMWMNRQQLPMFVLGAALCGLVLDRLFSRNVQQTLAIVLIGCGLVFAVGNRIRALVPAGPLASVYRPRSVQYFAEEHESAAADYIAAAEAINRIGCGSVGIDCVTEQTKAGEFRSPDSFFIYPLLALIHAGTPERKVWYTGVDNASARYDRSQAQRTPCAIICLGGSKVPAKWTQYCGNGERGTVFGDIVIFSREGVDAKTMTNP